MGNIFRQQQDLAGKPKRNTFDLSFQNNLTFQMGAITPLLCQECLAGDSFKIDMSVGIKLMPTTFPVQTPMDFVVHTYFVPFRTLWSDYMDYFGRVKQVTMPYLSIPAARAHELATGSLADYLGVPTTLVHQKTKYMTLPAPMYIGVSTQEVNINSMSEPPENYKMNLDMAARTNLANGDYPWSVNLASRHNVCFRVHEASTGDVIKSMMVGVPHYAIAYNASQSDVTLALGDKLVHYYGFNFADKRIDMGTVITKRNFGITLQGYVPVVPDLKTYLFVWKPTQSNKFSDSELQDIYPATLGVGTSLQISADDLASLNEHLQSNDVWLSVGSKYFSTCETDMYPITGSDSWCGITNGMTLEISNGVVTDATEISRQDGYNPFIDYGNGPKIPINALPFRAYEAIFWAYYANERLNPLLINGVPEYNKYVPNDAQGADTYSYKLHYRNWEDDYFTSCLDSPQMGIAPLVGVNSTGKFTFKDQNNVTYTMECQTDVDGTLTGINSYSDGMPEGNIHRMQELITHGISINDFRAVNSLQRWAEKNWRNGLKFRDQLRAHFGVTPKYDTLQMPQFIGGMHEPVEIQQITNLAASKDAPLGDFAGQGYIAGSSKHPIHFYCDEPGIIMSVGMIVPRPCYSQTLKKSLAKSDVFDYFFPEFANIGYQPVFNYELTPLQASLEDEQASTDTLHDVFGYQRPWADYIANYDEIHGQFRTTLNNFVMSRTFDSTPELGKDFITINPLSVNNVFAVDASIDDKFIGQVRFNISAKRPIPRFGIPRLE